MYRLTTDEQSQPQIEALPAVAHEPFAEVCTALELVPWNGDSINAANPDSAVRTLVFGPSGEGLLTYLIVEWDDRVDILDVLWID